jgi:hypothetical protein
MGKKKKAIKTKFVFYKEGKKWLCQFTDPVTEEEKTVTISTVAGKKKLDAAISYMITSPQVYTPTFLFKYDDNDPAFDQFKKILEKVKYIRIVPVETLN